MEDEEEAKMDKLKASFSRDWKELLQLQTDLCRAKSQDAGGAGAGAVQQFPLAIGESVLKEDEKRCRSQLDYLKQHPVECLPDIVSIQTILLERDQKKRLQQLQETLTYLRAKRQDLHKELESEQTLNENLQKMNTALKEKFSATEEPFSHEDAVDSLISEITGRLEKAKDEDKYMKRRLKQLLTDQFPLPDSTNGHAVSGVFNESRDFDVDEALSLKSILALLIEQTLNSPGQPYVDIDQRFWPPLVEFLLKSQIALKDQNNPNRIRLVPFHM